MGDLSITTPAHLNWVLRSVHEIRYRGWDDVEPCALPTQPGATLDPERVALFVCSRIVAHCPAVESRKAQLLRVLTSDCAKALMADLFWMLFLEFFALTDGVARVAALRHIVSNLVEELHGATDESEHNECLTDPKSVSIIENALRSGVQQGSALTQGFLSNCGHVTMDVTGVQTTSASASSSQQTTAVNVAKIPLPHHLTPKILEDIDSFSQKKREQGGSRKGVTTESTTRPSGSRGRDDDDDDDDDGNDAFPSCRRRRHGSNSSSHNNTTRTSSRASTAAVSDLSESERSVHADARRNFLRGRSRSVAEDSPEVLLEMLRFKHKARDDKRDTIVHSVHDRVAASQSRRSPSVAPSEAGSVASNIESSALSAARLTTRKASRKKIRLNSRASSLFLGECTQPDITPKTVLQLVLALPIQVSAAVVKTAVQNNAGQEPKQQQQQQQDHHQQYEQETRKEKEEEEHRKQEVPLENNDASHDHPATPTSPPSANASPLKPYGTSSSFLQAKAEPDVAPAVTTSSTANDFGKFLQQQQQQQPQQLGQQQQKESPVFGMTRAVLEEVVRAKVQDFQSKPYSGRTEATAALRVLRDARLLSNKQFIALRSDTALAQADGESATKKRGLVLSALEVVAEEQNRIFSRVSLEFANLMKALSSRSSFDVPRDMLLPFLSDSLAQMFCAIVYDVCPYLRSELNLETRKAAKRHLSFWLDGVDNDNVSGWTSAWLRPKLLHRHGAENTTVGGVCVGLNERQQQNQLTVLRGDSAPGQSALVLSPLQRRDGQQQQQQQGAGSASGMFAASTSASAYYDSSASGSGSGLAKNPLGKRKLHQQQRHRSPPNSSSGSRRRKEGKGGDPLSPSTAALNPANMAMQKHMELNQQLSLITGMISPVPPPRNARVELVKTFNRAEEMRRAEMEQDRLLKQRTGEREREQQRLKQEAEAAAAAVAMKKQKSATFWNSPSFGGGDDNSSSSINNKNKNEGQEAEESKAAAPAPEAAVTTPVVSGLVTPVNTPLMVDHQKHSSTVFASFAPYPPSGESGGGGDGDGAEHKKSASGVVVIPVPPAAIAVKPSTARSSGTAGGKRPAAATTTTTARTRPQKISTRLYNPRRPGSCLATPLDEMTNQEREEAEERRRRLNERKSPPVSPSKRSLSPAGSDADGGAGRNLGSSNNNRKRSPSRRPRRKSIHQIEQEKHQQNIVQIRERLSQIQEVLAHQQQLQHQHEEKERHRRQFMSAAAIAKEEEDKTKARRKQEAENKKMLKLQQQQQSAEEEDNRQLQQQLVGGGRWKQLKQAVAESPQQTAGFGLYWRGKKSGEEEEAEMEAQLQRHEHQQRAAAARRNHYRQPTARMREHLVRVHEFQEQMEVEHPGEYKYQPKRRLLSDDELAEVMQEQQDLMLRLTQESADVASAYERQMMEEMASASSSGLGGGTGGGGGAAGDDDDGDVTKLNVKKFGAGRQNKNVGAKDVLWTLEESDANAATRRQDVAHQGIGTRTYSANRGHILSARERLANANKLCRTHRFAPGNRPDQQWFCFGASHRPPPSATTSLSLGQEFVTEGDFALGALSPVMERFFIQRGMPAAQEIGLKYPSKMEWSVLIHPAGKDATGSGGGRA